MPIILNIETSTDVCSVAISRDGELLIEKESQEGLNHSKLLSVFIDHITKESGLRIESVDSVAVSKGPGSYTGLRIGVSLAKGLCYALGKPLIAVGTLDAMADYTISNLKSYLAGLKNVEDILICPMIDARRMEVYTSLYNINGKQIEPVSAKIITNRSFENYFVNHSILFCGNGSSKCKTVITHPNAFFNGPFKTSARYMFRLAEEKYKKNEFEDVTYFEPFYLKDFIATVPANKIIK